MSILGESILVPDQRDGHLTFGPLDLWVRRREGEWHLGWREDIGREDRPPAWEEAPAPENVGWERWVTGDGFGSLVFRPLTPDRSVVVRPEIPVRLRPGQSTDFFVGIPLWVEVSSGTPTASEKLCEFPTIRLSNTWFGTPLEGELCYALRTRAHRSPGQLSPREHRCICPLEVKNRSAEVLYFERICVRCQYLDVYRGASRFWTNAVRLSYRGRQEWSRVVYARNPPKRSGAVELAAPARRRISRGFVLRSFQGNGKIGGEL